MENRPMRTPSYLITDNGITMFVDGQHYAISQDHPNYRKLLDKLSAKDYNGLVELLDVRSGVRRFLSSDPNFKLENDLITFNGRPFSECVTDKVLDLIEAGNDASALFNFLRLVRQNPSAVAQEELLLFCVANDFMIDNSGFIVAYKSVNLDYTAIHGGEVFYKPFDLMTSQEKAKYVHGVKFGEVTVAVENGKTVAYMSRNSVDDRRENTCSYGLHFASFDYASTWAGQSGKRLLAFGVSPADVVSIPNDYGNQKGRAAKITVFSEIDGFAPLPKKAVYDFTPPTPQTSDDEDYEAELFGESQAHSEDFEDSLDELNSLEDRYVKLDEDFEEATRKHRPRSHILVEKNAVKAKIVQLCGTLGVESNVL